MKLTSSLKAALLIGSVGALASGCVTREEVRYSAPPPPPVVVGTAPEPGAVVVAQPPPPDPGVVETVPAAPDPTYIWIGGAWVWRGSWVWAPGHWSPRPHPHA